MRSKKPRRILMRLNIGLLELTPLTLCELHAQPMLLGGMPVPAFLKLLNLRQGFQDV